ncbi:MAG: 50S ribosomal protein L24 [Acidobacteriota bacterium]|nr:50S ribosomal protein L24 [Acidobacteriota bacterium]
MQKVKIKKNDEVLVTQGRDRGARGKVMKVFPAEGTAIVERINLIKRHTRANPSQSVQGGILEREAPIRLSNLKLVCPECGKPTRAGRTRLENGAGVRSCKICGATFN